MNLKYLLAVLNSTVFYFFMRHQGYSREGGYIEYKKQFVEQFPFTSTNSETIANLSKLVDDVARNNRAGLSTLQYEAEIDQVVFDMYKLNEHEIAHLINWSAKT